MKKNATFLISLLTSFVIHAYLGMYNLHGEMGHNGEMGLHGEMGHDPPVLRRVFPVLACLEGEDGEMMPSVRNCGFHEG